MTGDSFKPVATGDIVRPSARWHNEVTNATRAFQRGRQQVTAAGPSPLKREEGLIYLRNDTGDDLSRFDVVGLRDALIAPTQNLADFQTNAALTGELPVTPDYLGTFGICFESIPAGQIGRVCIMGTMPVQVNVGAATDTFADITNSDTSQLTSQATASAGCAQIINNLTATGTQWCLVRFPIGGGGGDSTVVKITGPSGGGGEYTGTILTGTPKPTFGANLTMPESYGNGATCLVLNLEEESTGTTWRLATGSYAVGTLAGTVDGGTTPVVVIRGALGDNSSPKDLTTTACTARTTTWDWAEDGKGVTVSVGGLACWDGTLLKQPTFTMTFDARGNLRSITAETMQTIDTPVDCS